MKLAIVPVEATQDQLNVMAPCVAWNSQEIAGKVYAAMIRATPPLSDEDMVRALNEWCGFKPGAGHFSDDDIARMRRAIAALLGE